MTWTRIDDNFHAHPKVQQAWHACPASIGLHVLALSYGAAYLLDGHVSPEFAQTCIPAAAGRKRAVAALVNAGLWEPNGRGWVIHDYLDHNPSREQVETDRAERSEHASHAANVRWGKRR